MCSKRFLRGTIPPPPNPPPTRQQQQQLTQKAHSTPAAAMGYHKVNRRAAHLGGSMPMAGLVRASAHARRIGTETGFLHTTTIEGGGGPSMQSVVANNDLDEMLSLADLAGKDYTAERQNVTVVVYVASRPAVRPP